MRMASSPPRVLAICKTRDRENVPRAVFIFCFFIKLIAPSTQNIQKENSCTNAGTKTHPCNAPCFNDRYKYKYNCWAMRNASMNASCTTSRL